jgi:methyl-accepting chemotaxis protein
MGQLSKATQQNASASEQLAATSEELSGQAEQLQQSIAFFTTGDEAPAAPARRVTSPMRAPVRGANSNFRPF